MNRHRSLAAPALLATLALAGCGDPISVPNTETTTVLDEVPAAGGASASIPTIALVLPDGLDLDAPLWEQLFRIEAAQRRVLVDVIRTPEAQQAAAITGLPSRGVASAVIVPDSRDPEVPAALRELAAGGTPVVLMVRGVEGLDPAPPLVAHAPVEEDARALAAAAVEDARKAGFPDDARAVVVTNGPYDPSGERRVAALEAALAETSLRPLPTIRFQGYTEAARKAVEPVVKEHPDLAILLTDDEQGAIAACTGRGMLHLEPTDRKPFLVAGFGNTEELIRLARSSQLSALAQRDPNRLARRAFDAAVALARGTPLPNSLIVPTDFLRAEELPDPSIYRQMAPPKAPNSGEMFTDPAGRRPPLP
jgi:ABC-type sugar transport system substrate-binding protein